MQVLLLWSSAYPFLSRVRLNKGNPVLPELSSVSCLAALSALDFLCRSFLCSFGGRYERLRIEMPAECSVFAMSSGLCEVQSGFGTFANANAACYIQKAGR